MRIDECKAMQKVKTVAKGTESLILHKKLLPVTVTAF